MKFKSELSLVDDVVTPPPRQHPSSCRDAFGNLGYTKVFLVLAAADKHCVLSHQGSSRDAARACCQRRGRLSAVLAC